MQSRVNNDQGHYWDDFKIGIFSDGYTIGVLCFTSLATKAAQSVIVNSFHLFNFLLRSEFLNGGLPFLAAGNRFENIQIDVATKKRFIISASVFVCTLCSNRMATGKEVTTSTRRRKGVVGMR